MAEQGFPGQHTTTTTVTTSNTNVQTNIRYDPSYIKTIPGMLKCAQLLLNILIFLSVSFSMHSRTGQLSFMSLICGLGFWFTGVLLAFYLFHIIEKFFKVPWLKIELAYTALWTLFLLIGSTMCAVYMGAAAAFGVVTIFGFINMVAYGYDCFLKYNSVKNGEIAQGERQVSKNTSQVTSPAAY
ncbi:hypothetical protein O3M35_005119 [Rhynocoris fuscipes]|uniref:MARVEL domain-containing protein n=1 Tax=Rhynocoris fuscipes TaxID=488301 RepID=A0AAW1DP84_9HEMI